MTPILKPASISTKPGIRSDDPEGWLERVDKDLGRYWEGEILRRALAYEDVTRPIHVIPGGQVMAAFVRRVEAAGGIGPIGDRRDLFKDDIHFNDFGAYLVALTHYAVLYGRSPVGLPHNLEKSRWHGNVGSRPRRRAGDAGNRVGRRHRLPAQRCRATLRSAGRRDPCH